MSVLDIKAKVKNNKLNLSGLNLTKIPVNEIAPLNVTHLDLSNNKIVSTDNVFTSLPGLVKLDLSGNRIKSVCGDIGSLQKLAYLSLADNEIRDLPKGMSKLKQLTHLSVNNNPLKSDLAKVVGPSQNSAQCRMAAANALRYLKGDYNQRGDKNKKNKKSQASCPQNKKSRNKTEKNAGRHLFKVFEFVALNIFCITAFILMIDVLLYALYEKSYGSARTKIVHALASATSNLVQKTCIEAPVKSYEWVIENRSVQQYFENIRDSWQSLWGNVLKKVSST